MRRQFFLIFACIALIPLVAGCGGGIIKAAKSGNVESVRGMLESDPKLANATDQDGETPLIMASFAGNDEVVKLLLDKGADVNKKDKLFGWTALHAASQENRTGIVQLLIEKGANVNAKETDGMTPLDLAAMRENWDTVNILKSNGAKFSNE